MIEDDFYATIKLITGEEIFAKVACSEEEERTMLILSNPITIDRIKNKGNIQGYKVEPWLKTTSEDMFILNMDKVLTLSECSDVEIIIMHQTFSNQRQKFYKKDPKLNKLDRKMGYISTVNDAREYLEKIYNKSIKES